MKNVSKLAFAPTVVNLAEGEVIVNGPVGGVRDLDHGLASGTEPVPLRPIARQRLQRRHFHGQVHGRKARDLWEGSSRSVLGLQGLFLAP